MTRLERRYRSLLRLLPRWYRSQREEEMVGTFLAERDDDLELEYGWPGWREAWAVAALAVRTHLAVDTAPARPAALGGTIRLIALLGLLANSAMAVAGAASVIAFELRPLPASVPTFTGADSFDAGIVARSAGGALAAVGAFVLLLLGRRAAAKACAVAALLPDLYSLGASPSAHAADLLGMLASWAPVWIVTGCLFAGFHREAPAPAARPWLRAAGVALPLALCWHWIGLTGATPDNPRLLAVFAGPAMLPGWALVVGGAAYLFVLHGRSRDRTGAWPLALAAGAAMLLPALISPLRRLLQVELSDELRDAMVQVTAVQLAGLTIVGLGLATLGVRDYRRLPAGSRPHVTTRRG